MSCYLCINEVHFKEGISPEDPLLVSTRTGGLFSKRALQRVFERMAKMAGITGHCFHHLRRTYASHLYKASGYNLRLVQKQLGHANIRTTQIYADVFDEDLNKALAKLYKGEYQNDRTKTPRAERFG